MSNFNDFFPASGGGLAGIPYQPDVPVIVSVLADVSSAGAYVANRDYLLPFIVRADVSIDAVWWQRLNTTAANVYVGIYDAAGNLLTDCAVDADTTVGLHPVATTPVTLTAGNLYYLALNESAQVAITDSFSGADVETQYQIFGSVPAFDPRMTTSVIVGRNMPGIFYKARTAAALPSTQTMSGWTHFTARHLGGFVPA